MSNLCVVMVKPKVFNTEIREIPEIGNNDILVKVEYCGICGSDVHLFQTGKQGENIATKPMVLGHECAGIVMDMGQNTKNINVGDRVAIEPGIVCGICSFCKSGNYNLCPNMVFPSTPPYDGFFMQFIKVTSNMVHKLPERISTKVGTLLEPLACALNATRQGDVELGKSVVVIGAGTIGLLTMLACKARGATEIYITDVLQSKLDFAKQKGATNVINIKELNPTDEIMRLTDNVGVDIVIDCSGTQTGMKSTVDLVKNGGTIVLMGMPPQDYTELNFTKLIWKEATIKTSFRYRNRHSVAIKAISSGLIDIEGVITQEFQLENLQTAFEYVIENQEKVIKAIVKM